MEHGFRLPHDSVKEYVDGILVMENFRIDNPLTLPLFANGCPTLLFLTKKACLNQQSAGHFTLFGQNIKPGALILNETFTLIAYFFKPHSLISLFNVAGNELSDLYVDLHLVMQRESNELEEKLLNCATADKMVLLLDKYVLKLIDKKRKDTQRIAFATTLIKENLHCDNLKSVQTNLCVTEKHCTECSKAISAFHQDYTKEYAVSIPHFNN